ncbi:unnamed protein product [Linum trigynum]|uniref:Uncharacterized protein n=1 Tax=Linum trigynum TaxID=586398 RepID=A0AAV2CHZ5_9ROSI
MRGAISSLLLLCSLLGRWFLKAAFAVFEASLRNQSDWYRKPKGLREPQITSHLEGCFSDTENRFSRRAPQEIGRRKARLIHRKKRSFQTALAETTIEDDHPTKRCRSKPLNQWRFWLPHSSELDDADSDLPSLAGYKIQTTRNQIEVHKPYERLDRFTQATPLGTGTSPVLPRSAQTRIKIPCFGGELVKFSESEYRNNQGPRDDPLGDEYLCGLSRKGRVEIQNKPKNPSNTDDETLVQADGTVVQCR